MIYLTITFALLIISIPISFKVRVLISLGDKKIFYSIKLFGTLTLNSGFVDFTENRAVLRYARRKEKVLYYKDLIPDHKKTDIFRHFDFTQFSSAILLGGDDEISKLSTSAILSNATATVYSLLKTYKPYIKFRNDLILLEEGEKTGGLIESNIVINGVGVIKIIVKKLYEGVIEYAKRKVGKQN